jgi:8-oxo-dGTP pyrophosphatase MutT (NUDIX family)
MFQEIFFQKLRIQLLQTLPGPDVQFKLAPLHRPLPGDYMHQPDFNPRIGSVMILLFPFKGQIHTVYILRAEYKGVHSGQVSFPGGKFDPSDASLSQTALRETHEEIGIEPKSITILGELTKLYIPPSNFLVTPYVGMLNEKPDFIINQREVAGIIDVDLPSIAASIQNVSIKKVKSAKDLIVTAPFLNIKNHHVWGATAMITNELIEVAKRTGEFSNL